MNHLKITLVIALVLCVLPSAGNAQVRGTGMGNLVTVISDGPFDAGRNPALLALQPSDSAIAAYLRYRSMEDTDTDYNASLTIDVGEPSTVNAGGVAAYSKKLGGAVLGFAIGEMGETCFPSGKRRPRTSPPLRRRKRKRYSRPPFPRARARPAALGGSFIGVQLITGFGYKTTDKTKDYISGT